MKLALTGLFICLAIMCAVAYQRTGDLYFALGSSAFAVASIIASVSVLSTYKGAKR